MVKLVEFKSEHITEYKFPYLEPDDIKTLAGRLPQPTYRGSFIVKDSDVAFCNVLRCCLEYPRGERFNIPEYSERPVKLNPLRTGDDEQTYDSVVTNTDYALSDSFRCVIHELPIYPRWSKFDDVKFNDVKFDDDIKDDGDAKSGDYYKLHIHNASQTENRVVMTSDIVRGDGAPCMCVNSTIKIGDLEPLAELVIPRIDVIQDRYFASTKAMIVCMTYEGDSLEILPTQFTFKFETILDIDPRVIIRRACWVMEQDLVVVKNIIETTTPACRANIYNYVFSGVDQTLLWAITARVFKNTPNIEHVVAHPESSTITIEHPEPGTVLKRAITDMIGDLKIIEKI